VKTIATFVFLMVSSAAYAQQYRNFEIQPNGTGGYMGTYGNRNFDIDNQNGVAGHTGGRRPGVIQKRPTRDNGVVSPKQRNCAFNDRRNGFCR